VIQELARDHSWVKGVHLMRNYGQHNAVLCGIRLARNAVIVTLDDDLQHPPEEIPKLLEKLTDDKDVVYGAPAQETHGLWRDLASQVTKMALQSAMVRLSPARRDPSAHSEPRSVTRSRAMTGHTFLSMS